MTNSEPKIIYENDDVLVLNKPAGVLVTKLTAKYPGTILAHRLDKDTSGVIILAKNAKAHEWLKAQFKERKVKKVYRAIVVGDLKPEAGRPTGTITAPIGRHPNDARRRVAGGHATGEKREAVTHYQILQNYKNATYLEARPVTGRTHQLRVHFKYLGHPILGDKLYGESLPGQTQRLHAYKLKLTLPSGEEKEFEARLPDWASHARLETLKI